MLTGAEFLISVVFVIVLLLLSIIDIAFSSVNKISVRRLQRHPKAEHVPQLAALVESRNEVLMSIHVLIQLLLIGGAVFIFAAFERREIRYLEGMPVTILLMLGLILLFRQLLPRLIAAKNPEILLIRIFPLVRISQLVMRPFARVLTAVLNYFNRWEEGRSRTEEEETSEKEIQAFIDAGQEEGILSTTQEK